MRRTTSRRPATTRGSRLPACPSARSRLRRSRASEAERFLGEAADGLVACLADPIPRGACARFAAADDEVANIEVEVRRLARPFGNLVDVEVERPRSKRVQLDG